MPLAGVAVLGPFDGGLSGTAPAKWADQENDRVLFLAVRVSAEFVAKAPRYPMRSYFL